MFSCTSSTSSRDVLSDWPSLTTCGRSSPPRPSRWRRRRGSRGSGSAMECNLAISFGWQRNQPVHRGGSTSGGTVKIGLVIVVAMLATAAGCGDNTPGGGTSPCRCDADQQCDATGTCRTVCSTSTKCGACATCNGGLCYAVEQCDTSAYHRGGSTEPVQTLSSETYRIRGAVSSIGGVSRSASYVVTPPWN
jgi:hypothetical protein